MPTGSAVSISLLNGMLLHWSDLNPWSSSDLYNNISIHVADAAESVPGGVDTEDDLNEIIKSL